jgi:hypothetical protein
LGLCLSVCASSWSPAAVRADPAAAGERSVLMLGGDTCPEPDLVRELLEPLLGHEHTLRVARAEAGDAPNVRVRDLGEAYAIEVEGAQRTQADPARDCAERARVAAVFIALNLAPQVASPDASEPSAPPRPATPSDDNRPSEPSARTREDETTLQLGLAGFAALSYAPRASLAPGFGLEFLARRGLLQLGVRAGAFGQTRLDVAPRAPGGHVALLRLPAELFVGLLWRVSRFALGPALGVSIDALRAEGRDLARSQRLWRANVGGYVALRSQLWLTPRWALTALASGSLYPRVYTLRVEPDARSASTPQLWLAFQLGVLCRVR